MSTIRKEIMRAALFLIVLLAIPFSALTESIVAVPQLSSSGLQDQEIQSLTDALRSELGKWKKFRVMERGMMENILKEQGFQATGVCDEASCAITMGQLLAVQQMVLGSVGKVGKTYTLNVRLVDVATGSILADITEYHKGEIDKLLTVVIPLVAEKICHFDNENARFKKKSGSKKPLLIGASIGLVAAAVAVPVLIFSKNDSDNSKPETKDFTIQW